MTTSFHSPPSLPRIETGRLSQSSASAATGAVIHPAARYLPQPDFNPFATDAETPNPDPYVDYGRFLTAEGGILFCYKDLDERFRHTLWRWFAWTVATGLEGWFLFYNSPVHNVLLTAAAFALLAYLNWRIVDQPVEVYRRLELRPDCMIVDGTDVFWRRLMEIDIPRFAENEEGHQVLSGIYGTRFIEYLTVRRFDLLDRTPEVFASNLDAAMRQAWGQAPFAG